jgi:DNA-binding transcriptional regulator PaaX
MNNSARKLAKQAKAKEITKTILSICAVGGLVLLAGGGVRSSKKAKKLADGLTQYSLSRINECLKRLKMQDYIKYDSQDLTRPIVITPEGLKRISVLSLKDKIKSLPIKKWDHIWRLVTFDVKENRRNRRESFRRKLKMLNFYQLQKNIFITPFSIEKEIEDIARSHHLKNNILILHVASLGKHEEKIKDYFFNSVKKY